MEQHKLLSVRFRYVIEFVHWERLAWRAKQTQLMSIAVIGLREKSKVGLPCERRQQHSFG